MKGVADEIKALEARLAGGRGGDSRQFLLVVPNLPDASVPVGRGRRRQRGGAAGGRAAALRLHAAGRTGSSGPSSGILDFERAAKVSGARFAVQWGAGARLERALVQLHARPAHARARLHAR